MTVSFDIATAINYMLVLISAIVLGLILRLPIIPEKPMRNSWTISIVFPTMVIAVGFYAVISYMGWGNYYSGVAVGVFTALFAKYLGKVFPRLDDDNITG